MKFGARNQITATIKDVKQGTMMCQVKMEADGPIPLTSVMTNDSLEDLDLKPGDKVYVIIKAMHVLVARD